MSNAAERLRVKGRVAGGEGSAGCRAVEDSLRRVRPPGKRSGETPGLFFCMYEIELEPSGVSATRNAIVPPNVDSAIVRLPVSYSTQRSLEPWGFRARPRVSP